jgi:acyl carrier protein
VDPEEVKARLRQFLCTEILHNPDYPLRNDEPLMSSGLMDSFSLAQIGVFAEIQFNAYIPDVELTVDRMDTVDQMAAKIVEKAR